MFAALLLAAQVSAPPAQTPPASTSPTLRLEANQFVVSFNGREVKVPFSSGTSQTSTETVVYKRDGVSFRWDSAGLNIEKGDYKLVTRVPDIALTPRLFPRGEIIVNRGKIEKGERTKAATRSAGSQRIGNFVYFLPRWEDKAGKPWLEALVAVSFTDARPKPKLIGRFDGMSVSGGSNALFVRGNRLAILAQREDSWGYSLFDPASEQFAFEPIGKYSGQVARAGNDTLYLVDAQAGGRNVIVSLELASGDRTEVLEAKGPIKFNTAERPYLAEIPTNLGPALRNLETGVQMVLPAKARYQKTAFGIVVWPEDAPAKAALYSNERYLRLAVVSGS